MKLTDEEKRELIEFKDDDTPAIRGLKAELQLVMDMTPEEKRIHYQEQRVTEAENWLQWMIDSMYKDDEFIAMATKRAKDMMNNIRDFGAEESWLTQAELWTEIAQGTKANKYTLKDIRKQREKIWQEKRKLKTMQQNAESSQSSSHSRT